MASKINTGDYITIDIINDKELLKLFNELQESVQNRIVMAGFRSAGNIIKKEIQSSFHSVKKNKSETKYEGITKFLKMEPTKSKVGLKIGFTQDGYKYRWIQWGTKERQYKTKNKGLWRKRSKTDGVHRTGSIEQTNFFFNAVDKTKSQAQSKISDAILQSLEKTVRKYNANNKTK